MPVDATVKSLAKRSKMRVFRNLLMKRREPDGEYEANFQTIPSFLVKKWGSAEFGVSDIRADFFKYKGMTFEVSNEDGFFNDTNDDDSFFLGKLTIYRTLVRVDAGYIDDNGDTFPSNPTLYVGILSEGLVRTDKGTIRMETDHISRIFGEFNADQITGLGVTQTASDIVTKVRDHVDDNAVAIFQKYIPLADWDIQTTTNNYNIATSTSLQGLSVWGLLKKLAAAEDKTVFITADGAFKFREIETTTTVAYHLSGPNDPVREFGKNIIRSIKADESIKHVYNRVSIKIAPGNTTTSFHIKNEAWNWGDVNSSSFQYGVREYKYTNEWLTTATAIAIADLIFDKYKDPITKVKLRTKFIPGLTINDRLTITYNNGSFTNVGARYGSAQYAVDVYGGQTPGTINFEDKNLFLQNVNHNIDKFFSSFVLEEA